MASTTRRRSNHTRPAPRDHYQEVTDRIIAALEAGTLPWRKPWDPSKAGIDALPRNATTGRVYNGINGCCHVNSVVLSNAYVAGFSCCQSDCGVPLGEGAEFVDVS